MADYHTLFSEKLEWAAHDVEAQKKWANAFLRERDIDDDPDMEDWPDFCWEFEPNGIWIYSVGVANVDHVARFVSAFLKKFNEKGHFSLTWAETCTRPILGSFGGGAVWVTADRSSWLHTSNLLEQCRDKK